MNRKNIVNRMIRDVDKMRQANTQMLESKNGDFSIYAELKKAIEACKDIETIIEKMEREVS